MQHIYFRLLPHLTYKVIKAGQDRDPIPPHLLHKPMISLSGHCGDKFRLDGQDLGHLFHDRKIDLGVIMRTGDVEHRHVQLPVVLVDAHLDHLVEEERDASPHVLEHQDVPLLKPRHDFLLEVAGEQVDIAGLRAAAEDDDLLTVPKGGASDGLKAHGVEAADLLLLLFGDHVVAPFNFGLEEADVVVSGDGDLVLVEEVDDVVEEEAGVFEDNAAEESVEVVNLSSVFGLFEVGDDAAALVFVVEEADDVVVDVVDEVIVLTFEVAVAAAQDVGVDSPAGSAASLHEVMT